MNVNAPLLEVELTIHFDSIQLTEERLQYFRDLVGDVVQNHHEGMESSTSRIFQSNQGEDTLIISEDRLQILSTHGTSFPKLRSSWNRLIESFFDVFQIRAANRVSLLYMNEIELQGLRSFREHLNIGFEMPQALMERIEFFRSEFTYKYNFGEIHVWLQPDWDDQSETYCIQLSLESRHLGDTSAAEIPMRLQQLHEGIKDVFHQILSPDYIERLPQ